MDFKGVALSEPSSFQTSHPSARFAVHQKDSFCLKVSSYFFSMITFPLSYIYNRCHKPSSLRKVNTLLRHEKLSINDRVIAISGKGSILNIELMRTEKYQQHIYEEPTSLHVPDHETSHSFLQKFRPVVVLGEKIQFSPICLSWKVFHLFSSQQRVDLLWSPEGLVWHWRKEEDKANVCYQALVSLGTKTDERCAPETVAEVEKFLKTFPTPSERKCTAFFNHFEIVDVNNTAHQIMIKPKAKESRLSTDALVSHFQWAVAAIAHGGTKILTTSGFVENHAQLVVEGVDPEGHYFMWLADFNGDVTAIDITKKKLEYSRRSDVWKVPKEDVMRMWETILKEREDPSSLPNLNTRGRGSIGVSEKEMNCFDWVKEKLEMVGITFPKKGGNLLNIVQVTAWNIQNGVSKKSKPCSYHSFFSSRENLLV